MAGAAYGFKEFEVDLNAAFEINKKASPAGKKQSNFGMVIPQREVATYASAANIKR